MDCPPPETPYVKGLGLQKKYQWVGEVQGVATLLSQGCIKDWWLRFNVGFILVSIDLGYFNHYHSSWSSQHLKYQSLTPHKDSDI